MKHRNCLFAILTALFFLSGCVPGVDTLVVEALIHAVGPEKVKVNSSPPDIAKIRQSTNSDPTTQWIFDALADYDNGFQVKRGEKRDIAESVAEWKKEKNNIIAGLVDSGLTKADARKMWQRRLMEIQQDDRYYKLKDLPPGEPFGEWFESDFVVSDQHRLQKNIQLIYEMDSVADINAKSQAVIQHLSQGISQDPSWTIETHKAVNTTTAMQYAWQPAEKDKESDDLNHMLLVTVTPAETGNKPSLTIALSVVN